MPLHRRVPKRGFVNIFSKKIATLNVQDLEKFFEDGATINLEVLAERGLIPASFKETEDGRKLVLKVDGVKILAKGELTKKFTVQVHQFSKSAAEKINAAGGSAEVLG